MEQNPWKTPFGRLVAVSALLAAVVGFSLAAGVMTYFRTPAANANDYAEARSIASPSDEAFGNDPSEAKNTLEEDAGILSSEAVQDATPETRYYSDVNDGPLTAYEGTSTSRAPSDEAVAGQPDAIARDEPEVQQ
ncbi:MAG TPA: hypothetical protein VM308_01360 [Sphingomicrobium sp.]|nr:hypothetical protein [Sphingomicrobium sp.]